MCNQVILHNKSIKLNPIVTSIRDEYKTLRRIAGGGLNFVTIIVYMYSSMRFNIRLINHRDAYVMNDHRK